MSETPSLIASAIAVVGSVAVAAVQRGVGAAAKELVDQLRAELAPRIAALDAKVTDFERRFGLAEVSVSTAIREAGEAKRHVGELRTFVQSQLSAARADWSAFKRESGRGSMTTEIASAEDVGALAREVGEFGRRLATVEANQSETGRRLGDIATEMRDDRRAEGEKQRELGGLVAMLKLVLQDRDRKGGA